ncbi:hypothetical protein TBCH5v1_2347 [Thermococcus barophilus]|uniref:Uncharacterized protein n=1 Tax=Thermococcus barophilus TaxID=55802 RepID=A0A0S1XEU1_THEBA|nr:hypothetical protein TBCH5v1_2347 [Thermococcus barophilus]
MHIYYYDIYSVGEKEWPKWAKWPLKIAALIQEFWAKRSERHAYTSALIRMCPQLWRSLRLISRNSLINSLELYFSEKRWVKCS